MKKLKVRFDEVVFAFVYKGVPDVVPEDLLVEKLEERGFEIEEGPRVFEFPGGEMMRLDIARKGDVDVLYDPRESFIGVGTKTGNVSVLTNYIENLSEILRELELDSPSFYRISARGRAWYGKNVKESLKDVLEIKLKNVEEKLGVDFKLQPACIRLIPADMDFGKLPWIDLLIEPLVNNPKYYRTELIYQDLDLASSLQMLRDMGERIANLLKSMGGK